MKVLVVEDDEMILDGLRISLRQDGYEVITASDQSGAFELIRSGIGFDICLLDVMLPDGNGYEICREIRRHSNVPILFLTACDDEVHTVLALEQGADDYIAKPFRIRELLARMKAILRRAKQNGMESTIVYIGENELYMQTGKLYRQKEEIVLTAMEYKLLLVFVNHRGQILTRQQILNVLWDQLGDYVNDNTLTVYIKRLREKLGAADETPVIETIRGVGYRLK